MLAADAEDELARDRDGGCGDGEEQRVGPQQQTEREAGDERAAGIERRQVPDARAEILRQERGADHRRRLRAGDLEVEPDQAVGQQRREQRDLVMPRVAFQRTPPSLRTTAVWKRLSVRRRAFEGLDTVPARAAANLSRQRFV